MTKEDVKNLMLSSKSEAEWNNNCDKVQEAHNGNYPDYWYQTIIIGGILAEVRTKHKW